MNNAKIYLCKSDCSILGYLTGIKTDTCNLRKNATDLWEISFDVDRFIDKNGQLVQSDFYDSIDDMMRLYLDSENTQAYFVIDSEPVVSGDGLQEVKTVTAHSIESELCNTYLKNFKINCGTPDSQEYLACDIDDENNKNYFNVNPYTRLPYNYISLVNYDEPQISLLHLALQGTGWSVKDGLDTNVYLDKDKYFRTVIHTIKDPSGISSQRITGYLKKKCNRNKQVYAVELNKWASSGIEFTAKDITDVTIIAQSINTVTTVSSGIYETVNLPSPIALVDSDNKFYDNTEGLKTVSWKSEDENGITLTYKNLKPGTYRIISPYDFMIDNSGNKTVYDYGVQIKSITVSECDSSSSITQHAFNSSSLFANADNEEIVGICQIKKSFETSDSVYSFLMKTVSPAASVIFDFDRKNKQVGIISAKNYGKDTGIFVTMRNLMNSFEVSSTSNDSIITKLTPTGADNLGIEYVNFGKDYIINLDYFMNTLNEYGNYKYVSAELHDKYNVWKDYRDKERISERISLGFEDTTIIVEGTRREVYRELSKLYNKTISDISELRNRLPNDGCMIDYRTYKLDELKTAYTAYNNALAALVTAYKNEYGVTEIGDAPNYAPTPFDAVNIKNTPYWYDYYAYKEQIIPSITEAFKMYCKTDKDDNLMVDEEGHYIELEYGNPDYYTNEEIIKQINAYQYEWSLYGLDELESKKKAWGEASSILQKDYFVDTSTSTVTEPKSYYITTDSDGWNKLSPEQKKDFTSEEAFITQLNLFLDYMSFEPRQNSLTGKVEKGIIRQCEDAIVEINKQISAVENARDTYQDKRKQLSEEVAMENEEFFTKSDLHIIEGMLRQMDYNNENIITTSLDTIMTEIDVQEELYQDAMKELNKLSQPQYSFSTRLDNLYSLEEFKSYWEPFDVGNFIRVGLEIHEDSYENNFVKLRLMSISYNPLEVSEDLSVEFSTMTKTLNTISDLAFLLNAESSSSTSSSGGSSSGSGGGTYGNNDASVQMSNTMLNALLNTELFGTAVNDVILDSMKANKGNFGKLFAHSGVFDSLEAGQIKVSGDCLFDYVKSSNYVKNKSGSYLNLADGSFEFAGGLLKWDGATLSVEGNGKFTGDIVANSLTLGNKVTISTNSITGLSDVATSGEYADLLHTPTIPTELSQLTGTDNIVFTDDIEVSESAGSNGVVTKKIKVGSNEYTTITSSDGNYILTNVGIQKNDNNIDDGYFCVDKDGLLVAHNALIYGTVYATSGKFTGEVQATSGTFKGRVEASEGVFNGEVNATSGSFTGNVTATTLTANQSGSIAGWNFNDKAFYKNDFNIGSKNGFYIGEDGISMGDYFIINKDGMKSKNIDCMNDVYDSIISGLSAPISGNTEIELLHVNSGDSIILELCCWFHYSLHSGGDYDGKMEVCKEYPFTVPESTLTLEEGINIKYDKETNICIIIVPPNLLLSYEKQYDDKGRIIYSYKPNTLSRVRVYTSYHHSLLNNIIIGNPIDDPMFEHISIKEINMHLPDGSITTYEGTLLYKNYGLMIDTINQTISGNKFELTPNLFNVYDDFNLNFYDNISTNSWPIVRLNKSSFVHRGIYNNSTVSSGSAIRITDNGEIRRYASSSKRYKTDITTDISNSLSPTKLYDLDIVQFKYNEGYLSESDQRYNTEIIGFIAEDVYEKYPIACNLDKDGLPEVPEYNMLIAPMLKLIQNQHTDIERLKEEINELKQSVENSEVS